MPKAIKKPRKASDKTAQSTTQGIFAGLSAFWRNTWNSSMGHTIMNASRFTRSGIVTLGSVSWYVVTTVMIVIFPIRRAMEMEAIYEEDRQREMRGHNPDIILPNIPGLYNSGSGASTVPINYQ